MRRQHFYWTFIVLALVLTIYGGYTLFYNLNHGNEFSILSLVFLILGTFLLVLFLILHLLSAKKKDNQEPIQVEEEPESNPEPHEEPQQVHKEEPVSSKNINNNNRVIYRRGGSSIYDVDDIYVKKVGYGSLLRVTGNRILDMRTNTYYRIQGNMVNQDGGGPAFEISDSRIRSAFGGYLYEISGNNINKVFGGFYASVSGNYITLFDSSEKYETTGSLNQKQLLVVVALLFGAY